MSSRSLLSRKATPQGLRLYSRSEDWGDGLSSVPFLMDGAGFVIVGPTTQDPPTGTAATIPAQDHAATRRVYYLVRLCYLAALATN